MSINIQFCRLMLHNAREEARKAGIKVPKRLTAITSDKRSYFVEGVGMHGWECSADNAYDAKAKFIFKLIHDHEQTIKAWTAKFDAEKQDR